MTSILRQLEAQDPRLLAAARKVASRVPKAALVGGFVRDSLLGIRSKDADLETYGIEAKALETILKELFHGKMETVGRSFGIFKVFLGDGLDLDVGIPRSESKTGNGHKGFKVEGDPHLDPTEAARRRDFTMNAISADSATGDLFDPFHGADDLEARRLKVVDASTFVDDPLRVYRGVQLAARFGLAVEPATIELMRLMVGKGELAHLSKERITDELRKLLLKAPKPSAGFELMREIGLIRREYPELHALIDTKQEAEWHPEGDVWIHSMMVLDQAAKISGRFTEEERLQVMIGALCHDLGKPSTTKMGEKNGVPRLRSLGHEEAGVEPAKRLLSRLTFGESVLHTTLVAAREHLKTGMLARELGNGTLAEDAYVNAVRKLVKRIKPTDWKVLVAISEADFRGRAFAGIEIAPYAAGLLFAKTVREHALDAEALKPLLYGRDLAVFGIPAGPEMGILLKKIEALRDEGTIKTREDALGVLAQDFGPPNPFHA